MMAEAKDKQSKCKHDYLTIMGNTVCRKCGKFKDD